ncbi:hypothetical protein KC336_g14812, partial [Hortaea werneckii]
MVIDSAPALDGADAPEVQAQGVEEGDDGDDGEGPRGRERDGVAEVEQSRGDGAEDDGEFELE